MTYKEEATQVDITKGKKGKKEHSKYSSSLSYTNEGSIDRVVGGRPYQYVGDGRKGKVTVSGFNER